MKSSAGIAVIALAAAACQHRPAADAPAGPTETLASYARALEEGRVVDAYAMLADDAKRSTSFEAFARMVKESPEDVRDLARALVRPASLPLVTAVVRTATDEELELVLENGAWTIRGLALDRYGQTTPRQALLGFLRAFERGRFDVLMRYVPEAEREGQADGWSTSRDPLTADKLKAAWTGPQKEEITAIVQAIRTSLSTSRIEETGDRAAMSYGSGGTVSFVRERGAWRIVDLK